MSACEALPARSPSAWHDRAPEAGTGCPAWCSSSPDCAGGHESRAAYQSAQHDAALLSTRLLRLDRACTDGRPLVMVSLGVLQLEVADKPTVELMPEEARRLAASLLRLAELAEDTAGPAAARADAVRR